MRCLSVAFEPEISGAFDDACALLVQTLKKRRVKVSAAPPVPCEIDDARVIQRGTYWFRCVQRYDFREGKICGRLDALYGKQVTLAE